METYDKRLEKLVISISGENARESNEYITKFPHLIPDFEG